MGKVELAGGFGGWQCRLPKRFKHMADESRRVAMVELLILFKAEAYQPTVPPRPAYSSAIATLGLLIG